MSRAVDSLMSKELRRAIAEYPNEKSNILCLIAKDQKEFLRAKRLISKVRINSWSFVGSLVLSSLALECPTCIMHFISQDRR